MPPPHHNKERWHLHSYMVYGHSRLAVNIGRGRIGAAFFGAMVEHGTSVCVAVDTKTGKVVVTSFSPPSGDEPRLLAWGGWSN